MTVNKTGNEIIAEFMGVAFKKGHTQNKYWHYDQLQLTSSTLIFDTSWDWLMPVVEKIESIDNSSYGITADPWGIVILEYVTGQEKEICQVMKDDNQSKISLYYDIVIQFITWYQNNKQPKQ